MIYATKDLLKKGETEYSIKKKLNSGNLYLLERGLYSDSKDIVENESSVSSRYPHAIITGLSAFYLYDLTDHIPDYYYLATEQHSFPIRKDNIKQSYQDSSFFEVGVIYKKFEDGYVRTYDLERLLIETIRLKEKYPREMYYEAINAFRNIKAKIDFYKLNQYIKSFKNGGVLLTKIKEII